MESYSAYCSVSCVPLGHSYCQVAVLKVVNIHAPPGVFGAVLPASPPALEVISLKK